jgi:hypothetical protein
MKVVLLHDCSDSGHFGCKLVSKAYHDLCEARDIEIIGVQNKKAKIDDALCERADLVIVNAEGSTHHGNYMDLVEVGRRHRAVFLNAVWEDMPGLAAYWLHDYEMVTVRESISAEYMETQGIIARIVPDVIFSRPFRPHSPKGNGVFYSDSAAYRKVDKTAHVRDERYVEVLKGHSRAVLGRFHAIALAAMLEIPFSAYGSNTHKNVALMRDMGIEHLYRPTLEEAEGIIPSWHENSIRDYVEQARITINDTWDEIAEM